MRGLSHDERFSVWGQSLKALLQASAHWFFSRGGVGIKFALAIILCAGLVWWITLAAIWPSVYASWERASDGCRPSCIASPAVFSLHFTRNYPIPVGRASQSLDALKPQMIHIAQTYSTFLTKSPATIAFLMGAARLTLAQEAAQHFELLVLDAN
jgi:hypothetical protein